MATFTYNSVTLPVAHFTEFRQDAVFEESQTDRILSRFSITLQALLNPAYIQIAATAGGPALQNPADIMGVLRTFLLQPRKKLSVQVNGVELIPTAVTSTVSTSTVDAKNGPLPQSCSIIPMTDTTFLITYSIVAHYWENLTISPGRSPAIVNNQPGSNVLSNRWQESIEIDDCNYSTRTREGKVIIRSDNFTGVVADQVRTQMAVVGVPRGFLRRSSTYTVDPSGLGLQYRVVDWEPYKKPPFPAFKAEGEYTESFSRYATYRDCSCRVKLYGGRGTDQSLLYQAALAVCMRKIANNATVSSANNIMNASVRLGMYENWVEVHQHWRYAIDQQGTQVNVRAGAANNSSWISKIGGKAVIWAGRGVNVFAQGVGGPAPGGGSPPPAGGGAALSPSALTFTPFTDDAPPYTPPYTNRGSAGLLLQSAAYYDPALQNAQLTNGGVPVITSADNPISPVATNFQMNNAAIGTVPGTAARVGG